MLIYFAAPLFNQAELDFNNRLTQILEQSGFTVFLPQREGLELKARPMPPQQWEKAIFELDRDWVFKADILLFLLDGRVPDEGAALELGLAYAQKHLLGQKKRLVGFSTDRRVFSEGHKLNAMLAGALDEVFVDFKELLEYLKQYRASGGLN
jgi:nucleoside 2-deoxyribosyltransferase